MAHLYWVTPDQALIPGAEVSLVGDEAHHASRVGRLREGEHVRLGNGTGTLATATALRVHPEEIVLEVTDAQVTPATRPALYLVQALAKSGRDEAAIEMATEVGVSGVIPLHTERTVVKWDEKKAPVARARWERIVREAAKQSLQPWIPSVSPVLSVSELIYLRQQGPLIVLDPEGVMTVAELDRTQLSSADSLSLVVGPEGGFSPQERETFVKAGAMLLRLGPGVLRASTAGPIALALLHHHLGHWGPPRLLGRGL